MKLKTILSIAYFIALILALTIDLQAQWSNQPIVVPEDTLSDPFKVPDNSYLSGLMWETDMDASITSFTFLVARYPGGTYVPLEYDDVIYTVTTDSTAKAISLKFPNIYQWEMWKIEFDSPLRDSIIIYPQYVRFKN